MNKFRPHIVPIYPPNNHLIFEEWFWQQWDYFVVNGKGKPHTDRELLPFFPTSYWVNNNYAQDLVAKKEAQDYINSLPNDTKYFVICQYDDGCLIDWGGKDVLEFNMSKKIGVELPLLCMPHPYKFSGEKKYLVNFVGSRTHPLRDKLDKYKNKEGWYISFERHDVESYCRIMSESVYTLCPRGYGINSFRVCESLQYNSIPIYISDSYNHIIPFDLNFYSIGMLLEDGHADMLDTKIETFTNEEIAKWQENIPKVYNDYFTYDGCFNNIIKSLETEFDIRKEKTEIT